MRMTFAIVGSLILGTALGSTVVPGSTVQAGTGVGRFVLVASSPDSTSPYSNIVWRLDTETGAVVAYTVCAFKVCTIPPSDELYHR
jgi:hypothetical protein